jgi:hypothetical protein
MAYNKEKIDSILKEFHKEIDAATNGIVKTFENILKAELLRQMRKGDKIWNGMGTMAGSDKSGNDLCDISKDAENILGTLNNYIHWRALSIPIEIPDLEK